jgi:hypothetical protein
LTAAHADRALQRDVEKLRDETAARQDDTDLGTISSRISALEADAESADRAPTAVDTEMLGNQSHALDEALRAWHEDQAAIEKLNARLRRARLPAVSAAGGD